MLAANVDAAFLLAGLDDDFSLRRLERYITTAWESGASPIVVLTKPTCATTFPLPCSRSSRSRSTSRVSRLHVLGTVLDALVPTSSRAQWSCCSVLGVGKSTLLNLLAGAEVMKTRAVAADGTGRHTTVHRELVPLAGGGLVIDTPGPRELQFREGDINAAFEDIETVALECRFRLRAHDRAGLRRPAATDAGTLELDRLRSWRKLQREPEAVAARPTAGSTSPQAASKQAAMIRQKSRR